MKKVLLALPLVIAACTAPEQTSVTDAFNVNYLDTSVAPCEDFFQHTAGGWIDENPIPETETRWGRFNELIETNKHRLKTILEEVSAGTYEKGTDEQLIGDLFASAMDSLARNEAGLTPLMPYLEEVAGVASLEELFRLMGENKYNGIGAPLSMYVSTDAKNSSAHALYVGQSGIGLPDRDYYLKEDSASLVLQQQYRDHIAKVSALVGKEWDVDAIYNLEKAIAQAMKSRVEMRNSVARYNPMTLEQWQSLAPNMPITAYVDAVGVRADTLINSAPEFFSRFNEACAKSGLETWKQYYQWHVADAAANILNDEFETLNFEFYSKVLRGVPKMNPRWKRAQGAVGSLGDQLGHLYADRYFPEESKAQVEAMVEDLRAAFRDRINGLTWMSDTTKEKALAKLDAFTYKIGYPDKWEDLSDLDLSRASYFENSKSLSEYFTKENLSKLDEPVDKDEWGMGAHIVNAYYNPLNNEIVFPAGILQPPFFNPDADDAINYGAIGGVIGHEFSHGFDDQGANYGADGNLQNWWTAGDKKRFDELTTKLAEQYDAYEVLPGVNVNGRLTLGENIADLGGLTLAYHAYLKHRGDNEVAPIDGFTDKQRIFLGWAQVWQMHGREEYLKNQVVTDPHSPGKFRVNGPMSNMPEFVEAFGGVCTNSGLAKAKEDQIIIW
jgi:putative endopeptidase